MYTYLYTYVESCLGRPRVGKTTRGAAWGWSGGHEDCQVGESYCWCSVGKVGMNRGFPCRKLQGMVYPY